MTLTALIVVGVPLMFVVAVLVSILIDLFDMGGEL